MIKKMGKKVYISFEYYRYIYNEYKKAFRDNDWYYSLEILEKILLSSDVVVFRKRSESEDDIMFEDKIGLEKARSLDSRRKDTCCVCVDDAVNFASFTNAIFLKLDYAFCLTQRGSVEEALAIVGEVDEALRTKKYEEKFQEAANVEFRFNLWKRICKIYAECGKPNLVDRCLGEIRLDNMDVSYWNLLALAKVFSYSNNYDLALSYYERALTLAKMVVDDESADKKDRDEASADVLVIIRDMECIKKCKEKGVDKFGFCGVKSYGQFLREGKTLVPGMIITCSVNNIGITDNSELASVIISANSEGKPRFFSFLVQRVVEDKVYIIPVKKFDASKQHEQVAFSIPQFGEKLHLLKDHIYVIPKLSGAIVTVDGQLPNDVFSNVMQGFYIDSSLHRRFEVADAAGDSLERCRLILEFIREKTSKKRGKVGERLIINDLFYHINFVDEINKEYVVTPASSGDGFVINKKIKYRIPFGHDCIFSIIPRSSTSERRDVECDFTTVYRFVEVDNVSYLIVGEDGDAYICRSIMEDDITGERSELVYLSKSKVDLSKCCNKAVISMYFKNLITSKPYGRKYVNPGNNS